MQVHLLFLHAFNCTKVKVIFVNFIFLSKNWGLNINRRQPFYGNWIEKSFGMFKQFHLIKCSLSPDIQIIQQVFDTVSYNGTIAVVIQILWTKGGYHYHCTMMVYWVPFDIWPSKFDFSTLLWLVSPTTKKLNESPFVKSWSSIFIKRTQVTEYMKKPVLLFGFELGMALLGHSFHAPSGSNSWQCILCQ